MPKGRDTTFPQKEAAGGRGGEDEELLLSHP